jgi:hypothetical protein
VLNGVACNVSGRNHLAALSKPHPPKAQISKFKIKETEHTHHFLLVDLVVIAYFITLGVLFRFRTLLLWVSHLGFSKQLSAP